MHEINTTNAATQPHSMQEPNVGSKIKSYLGMSNFISWGASFYQRISPQKS